MHACVRAHWPSVGGPLLAGTAPDRTTGVGRRRRDGQRQSSEAHAAAAAAHEPGQRTRHGRPAAPAHVPARTSGYWLRRTSALIALVPPQVLVRSILLHATRIK
jgi:hypothetical protein